MLLDLAAPSVLAAALLLDALIGDPRWLWGRVPHPIALLGGLIDWLDRRLNRRDAATRHLRGIVVLVLVTTLAAFTGWVIVAITDLIPFGWLIEAFCASVLIAQRDLYVHVRRVAQGLRDEGLDGGRAAVAHIVGRDPKRLDDHGVGRATIESCAENFADGVVAPVFWFLLFGLPGMAAYKAVNTLDSMLGHKSESHRAFGAASAHFDDVVNWIPARLSAFIVVLGACFMTGSRPGEGLKAVFRDAPQHNSPNAGWPEAAFAGALGIAIAGPRQYGHETVDGAWMGDGRTDVTAEDIDRSLKLYVNACIIHGLIAVTLLTWL
ncbi:MAG: adenosylcobinamide-phosphate synthase CbiB [Pseudomonadota bacterium]